MQRPSKGVSCFLLWSHDATLWNRHRSKIQDNRIQEPPHLWYCVWTSFKCQIGLGCNRKNGSTHNWQTASNNKWMNLAQNVSWWQIYRFIYLLFCRIWVIFGSGFGFWCVCVCDWVFVDCDLDGCRYSVFVSFGRIRYGCRTIYNIFVFHSIWQNAHAPHKRNIGPQNYHVLNEKL